MYDLVMKDKGVSTFVKLKERMRGKRRSSSGGDEDSASAVLPGGYGSLCRMRQRLPSDGGGEEDYEDDEGGEVRRSKMRTFFLRGKLRKSSDTRSSTSLGSESSESSSRGGSLSPTAGISVVVSDLSNSPSNSSNLTVDNSPEHTANTSPKSSSSLKCEFGDEAGEISIPVPHPSAYVNGSHAYRVQPLDPGSGKPAGPSGLGPMQKSLPLSMSLQNLNQRAAPEASKGPVGDGRRWSFDKPGEEEKAAIAAALEQSGPMLGDEEEQEEEEGEERAGRALAKAASYSTVEAESQGKRQRRNFLSHGRSESAGKGQSQASAAEERPRGWFGAKDPHSKPSPVVSPKLELSTDPHPSGSPVDPPLGSPLGSPLHHTNPFSHSQSTPPPMSPCNPFFSLLQQNPFYEDLLPAPPLNASLPPLPFLSSARPPIALLFPEARHPPNPAAERRPLPPIPSEKEWSVGQGPSNPEPDPDPEWDESFEAFAAGRLQPPEDPTSCRTHGDTPRGRGLESVSGRGAFPAQTDPDLLATPLALEAPDAVGLVTNTSAQHVDMFAQFLETIPEHSGSESDPLTVNAPSRSQPAAVCTDLNQTSRTVDPWDLTTRNLQQAALASTVKPSGGSPDPGSSGLGSSAEEDFFSCPSSYSDKFSASSSEEVELQNFECGFGKSFESVYEKKSVESQEDVTDGSDGPPLVSREREEAFSSQKTGETSEPDPEPQPDPDPDPEPDPDPDPEPGETEAGSVQDSSTEAVAQRGERCAGRPSLRVVTSSPDSRRTPSSSPAGGAALHGTEAASISPIPFGLPADFLTSSHFPASQRFGATPSRRRSSDHSGSSFLYVSVESQSYQTCQSHRSSSCSDGSDPNQTLHAANATLRGELQAAAMFDHSEPVSAELSPAERPEGGLRGVESQDEFVGFAPAPLQRSLSEGTLLAPATETLRLHGFGSDPGTIQDSSSSSSALPGPPLPSPTSSAHMLTASSLVAFPAFASASANSPPRDAVQQQQQQQAANQQAAEQQAANQPAALQQQQNSPHPVKPLTTAMLAEEKRTEGRSVLATGLEKLKSTIHPGRSSQAPSEPEPDRKKPLTEGAGSYYHLNHGELVALLVQREAELQTQKLQFEKQRLLLAKRELELKRLKPQVRDLEDYIDTLLVRIMEQKPTLLQVRSKLK
ncbi:uncharacterized protein V6R79_015124 [Siganus canaliculatus]